MKAALNGAKVFFRRVHGHIIPIYLKHQKAADIAIAAGTFIGASVAAEKSRNAVASKIYYKGRKGFNNGLANAAWDIGVSGGLTYGAARKFKPVARGFSAIQSLLRRHGGF